MSTLDKYCKPHTYHWNGHLCKIITVVVGRWTRERKVAGLTPGCGAIKSTRKVSK